MRVLYLSLFLSIVKFFKNQKTMYKEVFKRMIPVFIGSVLGVVVVALLLYLLNIEDVPQSIRIAAITLVVYVCVQFFFVRREVVKECLDEHTVRTPLPIVYMGKKELYSEPYLDLNLLDKVWGIEVQDTFYTLLNAREGKNPLLYRCEAQEILKKQKEPVKLRLPSDKELYIVRQDRMKFKATVAVLELFGVKAEDWFDDKYLCIEDMAGLFSDEDDLNDICAMSMNPNDGLDLYAIEFVGYHVRFAAE